jgi:hypothetical protein
MNVRSVFICGALLAALHSQAGALESVGTTGNNSELRIISTFKTHQPGIFPFDNPRHGTGEYRLSLTLNGTPYTLQGTVHEENLTAGALPDPEAGAGIRYRFVEKIMVTPGTYRAIVSLPGDTVSREIELQITEGHNTLVIEPVYALGTSRGKMGKLGSRHFLNGLSSFDVTLNKPCPS